MIKLNLARPKYSGTISWLTFAIRLIGWYEKWAWTKEPADKQKHKSHRKQTPGV